MRTQTRVTANLRWAISFAHQHLLFHPFARGRGRPSPANSPAKQAPGEWETKVLLENKDA